MNSKYIAKSGILIALTIIILYLSSILPISKLTILTIASCFIPLSIIQTSIKNTILVYIACSLLSFFLLPINTALYYTFFFGIYGIVKYYIEKIHNLFGEVILKLLFFNILLIVAYAFFKSLLVLPLNLPIIGVYLIAQAAFLIYDYALTLIITYFIDKIYKYK